MSKRFFDNSYAVIGLGFGDEGKGMAVHSLAKQLFNPIVTRYSGGQQAGHTVTLENGVSHVFSNFGSGTLAGIPTFWSKYCTLDPVGLLNEFRILKDKGFTPRLYIDKKSPVTTPYDKLHNQNSADNLDHGTCGTGVGATFGREEKFYSLLAGDILHPKILKIKLAAIQKYYGLTQDVSFFLECCEFIRNNFEFVDHFPYGYDSFIFESSQGLLLDQNFGFFPNVTRSSVGTKNILEMGFEPHLVLVTRAFQTRHGNGPMTNQQFTHNISDNPKETNILNRYQGVFKRSLLDLDLIKYGMERDEYIAKTIERRYGHELIITNLDLVKNEYRYTVNDQIEAHLNENEFVEAISKHLQSPSVHRISSPSQTFELVAYYIGAQWAK